MDILLNGKPIEYEIESEATIGELLDCLSSWIAKQGCVLVSVKLDGQPIDFSSDKDVRSAPIASGKRLEVEAQNARVLVVETVEELGQYLDRVARLAPKMNESEMNDESIRQLLEGLSWSEDVLRRVEELLRISYRDIEVEGERMHKLVLQLGDIRDHIREAHRHGNHAALLAVLRGSLTSLCDRLARALPLMLEKASVGLKNDAVLDDLNEHLPLVASLPEKLEAVAVKISIGDSLKGMEEFAACVTTLEEAFLLVDRCRRELGVPIQDFDMGGKTFDERNQALAGILQELVDAFERKDRVLIGDLIEYEISPVTEALAGLMEKIRNSLKGACH